MTVKLFTSKYSVKRVSIHCTPLEYMIINKALQHFADVNVDDVKKVEHMLKEANLIDERVEE